MYTVGIKRRLWFGFRKYKVDAHSYHDGELLLNLANGDQERFPAKAFKVYADFWNHMRIERERAAAEEQLVRAKHVEAKGVDEPRPKQDAPTVIATRPPLSATDQEAYRRAVQRINEYDAQGLGPQQ